MAISFGYSGQVAEGGKGMGINNSKDKTRFIPSMPEGVATSFKALKYYLKHCQIWQNAFV